ncbi:tyrosine-type recombinase/integrase [Capnocytophaga catalasegens]|uniref:Tyr recombinase domain-containing protein n=1 Tax=Capnocytophaga catalasegens TaxID=1004260 RepID=A0AAV5AZM5_9FLAO|nr:site-specific integrase [Capnocytophaga catalasegens]GIZ14023.1 hypothetical protein RCZ03_00240 [Capnocytophaga catalasegens]GJM51092.1 hypothetical protein RCZ15_20650 [Capnocytophaga catalasegens]GJM54098.1 hypothetical protein RCZ16_24140 [Capnocytophaga catalasegens]
MTNTSTICSFTQLWVSPVNWRNATEKDLKKEWYVQCFFYDARFAQKYPKGFPYRKKLNRIKKLNERKKAVEFLLRTMENQLLNGYNPILKKYEGVSEKELSPETPFIEAFEQALKLKEGSKTHLKEIETIVKRLEKAASILKMNDIAIKDFKRSQLKRMLDCLCFPDKYYNKAVRYVSSLYRVLVEYECCETNITRDIYPKKIIKEKRIIPSKKDLQQIQAFTQKNYPYFYRFMMIFLYSGARTTELFRLQKKDIDLENREFTILLEKGGQYKPMTKVILQPAIPFWEELLQEVKHDTDFLFTSKFKPSNKQVQPEITTRFWNRHIKKKLGIIADFYSLKHYMLDSLDSETAMVLASHTNKSTTEIYQVHKEKRDREMLKNLIIEL